MSTFQSQAFKARADDYDFTLEHHTSRDLLVLDGKMASLEKTVDQQKTTIAKSIKFEEEQQVRLTLANDTVGYQKEALEARGVLIDLLKQEVKRLEEGNTSLAHQVQGLRYELGNCKTELQKYVKDEVL